jgi:CRISPR-associated protein Csb2
MTRLTIHCRFIARCYSGVRLDDSNEAELDWPPAPARLHQALIAVTLTNLPESLRESYAGEALAALNWLETLPAPEIIASKLAADAADDSGRPRSVLVAMPHNSRAKGDASRYHPDLAPVFRATPAHDGDLQVSFRWTSHEPEFDLASRKYLPALEDAVAKLRYLGRGEDRVDCELLYQTDESASPFCESMEIWRPSNFAEDVRLWTARPRSTYDLMAQFRSNDRIERGAHTLARRFLHAQGYVREAAAGLLPVHIAIFQVFRKTRNPDELPVVCDAINAHRWRSPLRKRACEIASERDRWDNPDLAEELISGHLPGGGRTQQPHLAFVPLPSLSAHGQADGRVRRLALLGYADSDKAASIYRVLASCLDGDGIDEGYRLQLIEESWRSDKVWRLYAGSSRVWLSATPVAIDRGYKVPTHSPGGRLLSSNERHLRRLAEWTSLLRASLRHIRLPDDLVGTCKIILTPSPMVPATERAEQYRAKDERAAFVHARIEFLRPVRGPLLVGDRRYQGLGLFVPAG